MSIQSEITRLNEAKSTLSNWLETNEIPHEAEGTLTQLAEAINNILIGDSLPVGAILDYDGETVPDGYEEAIDENEYSTTEQKVGTWIDGRPIYRKVIGLGTLPNNSSKYVETGLIHTNIRVIRLYGNACNSSGSYQAGLNDIYSRLNLASDNTLGIQTTINFSSFTGYAILEYTKTTD